MYVLCIFIQIHNVHICTPPKHFCNPFLWLYEKDFESKEVSHCNHQKRILSCVTFVSELILPDNTKREIGFYQMYLHIMYLEIYYTCTLHYDVNNTHYTMCRSLNNRFQNDNSATATLFLPVLHYEEVDLPHTKEKKVKIKRWTYSQSDSACLQTCIS